MNGTVYRVFVTACLAVLAGCTSDHTVGITERVDFNVHRDGDVPYYAGSETDGSKHILDVFQPEGVTDAPVLMYVHGGAWQFGSKAFIQHIGQTFAKRGIVTVLVDYRLSPAVKHPDHVRDVARAFDWLKVNAACYGGDPNNIFIAGHSAGGHLVSLLALNEKYLAEIERETDEIAGVITISGLYRVGGTSLFFKNAFSSSPDVLIDASPEFHVDDDQPPFLIVYAEDDFPLLDMQAIALKRTLDQHASPAKLVMAKGRRHFSIFFNIGHKNDPTTEAMLQFIGENSQGK